MSRTREITGSDDRGRPKAAWADPEPDSSRGYGFMEPAIPPTIERRKATPDELAAARAREVEPEHLTRPSLATPALIVGRLPDPEPKEASVPDVPTLQPVAKPIAQLPAVAPTASEPMDATLAVLGDAVGTAAAAWAEKIQADYLADQAELNWQQARTALDAAYRAVQKPVEASPTVDEIARAAEYFQRAALSEARASVALDGETQVVDRPKRVRTGEGQRPSQASARDRRAATVMSAMGRLDDDMDAVAAELGMKKNAVSQVVKHARLRAGTAS